MTVLNRREHKALKILAARGGKVPTEDPALAGYKVEFKALLERNLVEAQGFGITIFDPGNPDDVKGARDFDYHMTLAGTDYLRTHGFWAGTRKTAGIILIPVLIYLLGALAWKILSPYVDF